MNKRKMCNGITNSGKKCKKNAINNEKFCNIHHYKKDDCSICFEEKELKKLNCCSHFFCETCSDKVEKCPLCRKDIKLSSLDKRKIIVCEKLCSTIEQIQYKIEEDTLNEFLYGVLYETLKKRCLEIAMTIKNKYNQKYYLNIAKMLFVI